MQCGVLVSSMPAIAGCVQNCGKATEKKCGSDGESVWMENEMANEETANRVIAENSCQTEIDGHICC